MKPWPVPNGLPPSQSGTCYWPDAVANQADQIGCGGDVSVFVVICFYLCGVSELAVCFGGFFARGDLCWV